LQSPERHACAVNKFSRPECWLICNCQGSRIQLPVSGYLGADLYMASVFQS
jgi:hypothetical protein